MEATFTQPSNHSFQNGQHQCMIQFFILSLLSFFCQVVQNLVHLPAGGHYTYTSTTTAQSFSEAFSDCIEEELLQQFQGSQCLSILINDR